MAGAAACAGDGFAAFGAATAGALALALTGAFLLEAAAFDFAAIGFDFAAGFALAGAALALDFVVDLDVVFVFGIERLQE